MKEKSNTTEELSAKLKNRELNEDELEKINGGGLFIAVDPQKCPKRRSKYVIYFDRRFKKDACSGCEHIKEFGEFVRCEYSYTGNYEWEW